MLRFSDEDKMITIVAKDTGDFKVSIENYILDDGDTLFFTVSSELESPNPAIQKVITTFENNKAVVRLSSEDTNIPQGYYWYDVQVNTADGRVDTIVGPYHKFRVIGGATY